MTNPVQSQDSGKAKSSWKLPLAWREAAAFGALWGAVEVTVGTFLHTSRIPLAGVVMAATAVTLLTASMMIVNRRWFPLRTALVCAALRALSPEGLMPGPMIAIVMQGGLVSLAFIAFRKPLIAGIVIGIVIALSTQVQAFLVKTIAYGVEFIDLLLELIDEAETLLHLPDGSGWLAVALYLLMISLAGATGGVFGWRVGREALAMKEKRR